MRYNHRPLFDFPDLYPAHPLSPALPQSHAKNHFVSIEFDSPGEEMAKINVRGPVVELDGDEMTRIIWKKIREEVGSPTC